MRQIKFRYVTEHKTTKKILLKIWTLQEIELGELLDWINYDGRSYDLIKCDQFTGLLDKNNTEIYENDIVKLTNSNGFHCRLLLNLTMDVLT